MSLEPDSAVLDNPVLDEPSSAEAESPAVQKARPAPALRGQIKTDDSKLVASYANFARVTGTPEELIVDFALNPHPMETPTEPVMLQQRIVLNFYTAKRLYAALGMSLQRHEATFGVLETDVQKRVTPAARRAASQAR